MSLSFLMLTYRSDFHAEKSHIENLVYSNCSYSLKKKKKRQVHHYVECIMHLFHPFSQRTFTQYLACARHHLRCWENNCEWESCGPHRIQSLGKYGPQMGNCNNAEKHGDKRGRAGLPEPRQGHLPQHGAQTSLPEEVLLSRKPREEVSQVPLSETWNTLHAIYRSC